MIPRKQGYNRFHESQSRNDDFGARYYASSMGLFMSPDWSAAPSGVPYAAFRNPQSLNLYAYVGNDPINGEDADGHISANMTAISFASGAFATAELALDEKELEFAPAGNVADSSDTTGSSSASGTANAQATNSNIQTTPASAPPAAQQQNGNSASTATINGRAQTQYNNDVPIIAKQLGVSKDEVLDSVHIAYDDKGNAIVIGGHVNMTVDSGSDAQQALAARLGPGGHGYNEDPNTGEGRGSEFSRLGGTPSVHFDHSLLHVDRFNAGAWGGLGVVPHFFYDVLYGGSKGNVALLPY